MTGYVFSTTSYDGLGRKSCTQDIHSTATTVYAYDARSRVSCAALPFYGSCATACTSTPATTTTYDGINRPIQVTEAGGAVTNTSYGASTTAAGVPSFQTVVQDPASFWRRSATDAFGRLIEVQENPKSGPSGTIGNSALSTYTTTYGYDVLDDLNSVTQTDPGSNGFTLSRTFTYDSFKRLVQAINPESGTIKYQYDASGNLSARIDPVRTLTFAAYDGMNRITGKSYSDGITPSVNYSYGDNGSGCNQKGRLITVTANTLGTTPAVTNNYSCFDAMGRVTASSQQIGAGPAYGFPSYTYDLSGALATITYPSLRVVTYTYDPSGRIYTVTGVANSITTPYATNVQYAPQGAIQNLTLNNSLNNKVLGESWGFNPRQQPTSLTVTAGGGTQLMNLGWTYGADANNNGNIATHTIQRSSGLTSSLTQNFSYADPANRLSSAAEGSAWSQTYGYDAFGNRAVTAGAWWLGSQNITMPNAGYTPQSVSQFNAKNQWVRGSAGSCTTPHSSSYGDQYDCAGNQTATAMASSPYNSPGSTFYYDGENRLVTASVAGQGGASFVYDGEGRRVQKTAASGTVTTYVHDAKGDLAAEYSTAVDPAAGTQYLSVDHLGSTRLIADASGSPKNCFDYLPFGEEIPFGIDGRTQPCYEQMGSPAQYPAPPDVVNQKFTGKERDAETGLDFFGARYFSAAQGRFTSADAPLIGQRPADPQTWNLYAYVRNNPLGMVDPTGHSSLCLDVPQSGYNTPCPGGAGHNDSAMDESDQSKADPAPSQKTGSKIAATGKKAVKAVGDAMSDVSDFLNTAPGISLVFGAAIWAETGGGDETPAVAEAADAVEATLSKAVNLPSWRKLTVDWEHIAERHMPGGSLTEGRDLFLNLNKQGVLAAIRQAYGSATTVAVQGERVLLQGITRTGMTVQMWLNKAERTIETAYPVGK